MNSYCCLTCPSNDYSAKSLTDHCPKCGREYQFQLVNAPAYIGDYRIKSAIFSRGFYAVTFIAEYGRLANRYVLKVSSEEIYDYFGKDFEKECQLHKLVAEDSEYVVKIIDYFSEEVIFGAIPIRCNISVLEHIDGNSLQDYLEGTETLSARTVAQIALDLFGIIGDLTSKRIYHNDLHSGNIIIQELRSGSHRAEALDESIKAKVIDLGSVSDGSKSSDDERINDVHWVAKHLRELSQVLLRDPESCDDLDYRLASLLYERADLMAAPALNQRLPSIEESRKDIRHTFQLVRSPWKEAPVFHRLDEAYNAQTLQPWFVPLLLVDPDKQWQAAVSGRGPQIIVGMRGCGKTMLLRSLQFHARATEENDAEDIVEKLKRDSYLGLYVSCTKLLETNDSDVNEPFARLLLAFGLEALRAARHLRELGETARNSVSPTYFRGIAEALSESLALAELKAVGSEYELERKLIQIQIKLATSELKFDLKVNPVEAFMRLADAIKRSSLVWANQYVLFLLDDVSTRFLKESRIIGLLSQLIFQSDECAFKFTTEAQTLELVLKSPGQIEQARVGRDYKLFDLGADVYEKVRGPGNQGTEFVEKILMNRAKYSNYPKAKPSQILGNISLARIAEAIVGGSETSRRKKEAYWGISALKGVCVGDIGDVISLFDLIVRKSNGRRFPVSPSIQSECYQSFCSGRLYDANRKDARAKDFALSFAEAAHDLLVQSNTMKQLGTTKRLRQYNKIYVRITTGDTEKQYRQLRELIDSGVFVLAGGSDTPRTKTRDSNPIKQFSLTYRKLFGLSNFIGLSERDRFELSGNQLIEWLDNPAKGKEVLLRNLANETKVDLEDDLEEDAIDAEQTDQMNFQPNMFESIAIDVDESLITDSSKMIKSIPEIISPRIDELDVTDFANLGIDEIVIGLGFEERTLESTRRLLEIVTPSSAHLLYYPEVKGFSDKIETLVRKKVPHISRTSYTDLSTDGIALRGKTVLVDITGLAKPFIFQSVRSALRANNRVLIANTNALVYYPRDEQINQVFSAASSLDSFRLIEKLSEILVSGEEGKYRCEAQLRPNADESRRRALFAFASAKHERLFTLLDERDYDHIELVVPKGESPKDKMSKLVAEVAASNYPNAGISEVNSHDPQEILGFLYNRYNELYVNKGFNFEIALSGTKIQTVACAVMATAFKISQTWYVRPERYNLDRFTEGVGESRFYSISV